MSAKTLTANRDKLACGVINTARRVGIFVVASLAFSQPAIACSWSYERGMSPDEIKRSYDYTAVRATFRFEELRGERRVDEYGREWVNNPEVVGVVERGALHLETVHTPQTGFVDMTCIFPARGPAADARGTFWISTRPEHGRYRIMHWEGEYLPPPEDAAEAAE